MNKFLIIFLLAFATCKFDVDKIMLIEYQKFIKKYSKNYKSMDEYLAKFEVFKKNVFESFSRSNPTFKTGVTKFSDMTQEEFAKNYLGLNYADLNKENFEPVTITKFGAAPPSFDWRNEGRVSEVKEQGNCKACYAFTTIGNLEGLYYAKTKVMTPLSEQMIVDCDNVDGGCRGGLMKDTIEWIKSNGGIMAEKDYPYKGKKGLSCKKKPEKYVDLKVTGYKRLGSTDRIFDCVDENQIKEFLYENGPLIAAVNSDHLKSYTGGIVDVPMEICHYSGINHGVLIVGYGTEGSTNMDYWTVKNSLGKDWGESGYFRIRRGAGTCGINCYIMTATIE
jgi:cathepsin F